MNDEDYIDIAIKLSKKAVYPYGAIILYTGIEKLVYGATLEDSKECVNEILVKAQDIANNCKNRKIEIISKVHRDKAIAVLKNFKEHGEK